MHADPASKGGAENAVKIALTQFARRLQESEGHLADLATVRQVIVSLFHSESSALDLPDLPGRPSPWGR